MFTGSGPEGPTPGTTGKYLVLFHPEEDAVQAGIGSLSDTAGITVAHAADFGDAAVEIDQLSASEGLVFDELGVAVVDVPPDQRRALGVAMEEEDAILTVEPERVVYALQDGTLVGTRPPTPIPASGGGRPSNLRPEYLRGYQDAVNNLVGNVLATDSSPSAVAEQVAAAPLDESSFTWGLQATKAATSRYSGHGVKVAVLDTGFAEDHPDFTVRSVTSMSFIPGEAVQDGHGHGTHCIGTSCGSQKPGLLPRYGVAYGADIFAGKVLSDRGSGADGGILDGIRWAIRNNCHIISMSLGSAATIGQRFSRVFEAVARRALAQGTIIIAAAGNESTRPGHIAPVGHPANCPSIMAVGALDERLAVASFSCGGTDPQGGQVDIAGPGVDIHSSWPLPTVYRRISGTSMATPHVAGIAALYAEANPESRGRALWSLVIQNARRLPLPSRDVGIGLVQAP
jgi:subtilisin